MDIDARADLYAVGCILFELLTGRPPFVADGQGEIMAMHIYEAPPRLSQYERSLPPELDALVAKLLTKSPDDRTPSAAWALAALERVPLPPLEPGEIPLAPSVAIPTPVPMDPDEFLREKLPVWIPIAVIVVALAIAALAVYLIGGSGAEITPKQ
jgi:serine/threonine protein kinase